jgi:hypothetical protein
VLEVKDLQVITAEAVAVQLMAVSVQTQGETVQQVSL